LDGNVQLILIKIWHPAIPPQSTYFNKGIMFKAGFDRALFYKYKSRALSAKPNYKSCFFCG